MRLFDILHIDARAFRSRPQTGETLSLTWEEFAERLREPHRAQQKDAIGGVAFGFYVGSARNKGAFRYTEILSLDFDVSGVGPVAAALSSYECIVHETFSSTALAPRCRAFVQLAEKTDLNIYNAAHAVIRKNLKGLGYPADEGAKDATRFCYFPVREPGASYAFLSVHGRPFDASGAARLAPPPVPPMARARAPEHLDSYIRGALVKATDAVAQATPGERHYVLSREAYTLARLDVGEFEIHRALLPAFVHAAGEKRRHEGVRTIRDAIRARRVG